MAAFLVAVGALVALIVASPAQAVTVTPLAPTNGQSIQVTPAPGFGSGPVPFQWSISYDCPGPDPSGGKVSNAEIRRVGEPAFAVTNVAAPFLGSGTFTNPVLLSPGPTPIVYEWRVQWDCGGFGSFPGAEGFSEILTFTLLPLGGPAPQPAPAAPPAPTTAPVVPRAPPCAGLEGKPRKRCLARQRHKAQLKACAKLKGERRRAACVVRANAAYRRAIRATR